ncbi:MAG TPA: hypothetical protein PLW17_05700, partial [Limnochordia bacterium]|nr:hypothetical protein [Limnochordia bacterium]
ISGTNQYIDRYLIIEPGLENAELHFNPAIRSQSARFSARAVAFEKSIDFAQGGTASAWLVISGALRLPVAKTLVVEAEYVFFKDITLLYAEPSVDPLAPPAQYSLVLRIPAGRGQEIGGQRYGEVYFDGGSVAKKQFVWSRGPGILADYMLTGSGYEPEEIHTYEGVPLAGNAFYFRDGTDLLNPGPGQLIPIPDEKQKRNEAFKDLFIWE